MTGLSLHAPSDTERLGALLAQHLPEGRLVAWLDGDLGAGKTTTARALLRALGVAGGVRSPTYTLVERYDTVAGEVAHLDLYRIADPEELHYLALDELVERARLWLVEWPQRGQGVLPPPDLVLQLQVDGTGRVARLVPHSAAGRAWAEAVHRAWVTVA
ncbi:MAG: tRNA (adenosine(37)-N6)-threonylcarbamoyltransferase complex ATPase subunit type 1 TsaE [Xanthomonadaceae bacterium]|nr:tRNA (adenosine(37)-N6)-threonylcarbamoyltransferase complex ATPase subunit type 1 TsaE [Xanthomonadaceae bacterium]HRO87870.1 tRNA (adenosine(37)-N6)-threonylcarbamoyltransferase complex ATPase subunit type 1 TsaE [Chiayiivirga sp.]